jgi:hypothetical protein
MEFVKKYKFEVLAITIVAIMIATFLAAYADRDTVKTVLPEQKQTACQDVPEPIAKSILSTLDKGVTLGPTKAVKSSDFSEVYFISADLEGDGLTGKDDIATFATNSLGEPGMFYSVNGVAEQFSSLPKDKPTMNEHGAKESQDCLAN